MSIPAKWDNSPPTKTDNDLADDLRIYGSCFWKFVEGERVRVPIEQVRYIDGHAMEVGGEAVCSAERISSETEGDANAVRK